MSFIVGQPPLLADINLMPSDSPVLPAPGSINAATIVDLGVIRETNCPSGQAFSVWTERSLVCWSAPSPSLSAHRDGPLRRWDSGRSPGLLDPRWCALAPGTVTALVKRRGSGMLLWRVAPGSRRLLADRRSCGHPRSLLPRVGLLSPRFVLALPPGLFFSLSPSSSSPPLTHGGWVCT